MRRISLKSIIIASLSICFLHTPMQALYAEEITPDTIGFSPSFDDLEKVIERPDEELLIFELRIGDIRLSDALITYENLETEQYHVPLADILDALEFPIKINNDAGTAEGWFTSEDNKFSLSLEKKQVTITGKTLPIQKGEIENHFDGIYVSLEALEKWFPFTIDVDFSNLALVIKSLTPLPIENRLERNKNRDKIGPKRASTENTISAEKPDAPYFTLPFVDTSIQTSYTNLEDAPKKVSLDYSISARNIIFNQDAHYTINDTTNDNEDPNIRLTLGRKALGDDKLFLGLTEYALGDITTSNLPLIASSNAGRGAFLTNISEFESSFGGSDTITLRGELPVGYQVDIKRNGELLDFVEERDENGEYVFQDLFVLSGLNVFELVFYGPQGQEYTEEKRIFVPQTPIKKGAFEYRIQSIQDDTNLFTNRETSDPDTGEARITAEARYGLNNLTALRAAAASYSFDGKRKHFGLLGLSTSLFGLRLDTNAAITNDGQAASARLESVFKGIRWQIMHEHFNSFETETNESSGIAGELQHNTDIRISGLLPFLFLRNTPLTLTASRLQNTEGDERYEWALRATKNIKRIRFTSEIEQTIPEQNNRQTNLNIQLSSRLKGIALRGNIRYSIEPEENLDAVSLTSDVKLDQKTKLRLGLNRSGTEDPIHNITLGLNRDFGFMQAGVNTSYSDDGDFTALLSASFGFAYDQINRKPYFSSQRLSESSALLARTYRDLNANGIKNIEEPYLENVGFVIPGKKRAFKTNQKSGVFIPELRAYEHSTLEILPETFPNPFMRSEPRKRNFLMRPSQIHQKDYPIILTGEVDGDISIFKSGTKNPAASIQLDILNIKEEVIASAKSEFDGFFFVEDVPIGHHSIRVNPSQIEELGYCPVQSQKIILENEEPFTSIEHPFTLHPRPDLIEQNTWLILQDKLLAPVAQEHIQQEYEHISSTQTSIETGEEIEVNKQIKPRFILPSTSEQNLYRIVSGPYNELQALRTCELLKENKHKCSGILKLSCEDLLNLEKTNIIDN